MIDHLSHENSQIFPYNSDRCATQSDTRTRSYRILLLEDDYDQAEMIYEFLQLAGPFIVDLSTDIKSLWHQLAENEYDILLLDYKLPDGNGLEVLDDLPKRGYNIPVIMITGQGDEKIAAQSIQRGAMDYVVKGSDYLLSLPSMIKKSIQSHQMLISFKRSLDQIRYQAMLLNNVRDAVVVWELSGRITFWNPAAQVLFGWSAEERIGQDVKECYLNIFEPSIILPAAGSTSGIEVERRCTSKDGKEIWVSSRISALREGGQENTIIGYMDVVRNITERKRMLAQIQSAQTQLVQAARLAAIGELASGVAHQIGNPLTTIIAEAQLLLQSIPSDHPARESAEAIEKAGWRVQQAINHLLEFSRPAPDTLDILDVNETIHHALSLVGEHILASHINLVTHLDDELPKVRGNARQLEDLWVNLLLVARDATEDGKSHEILITSTCAENEEILIEVSHDGQSLSQAQLDSIFEPNFIEATTGRGSGMELSICREIVRQHRGRITAASNSKGGTTFRVTLPIFQ